MSKHCFLAIAVLALVPVVASAIPLGTGRLVSVTSVDGGCLQGPDGNTVQSWDVERFHTYTLTITNVFDCANSGMDPTINVRINSSTPGFEYTDLVAAWVAPGVYRFNYTLPAGAWCTFPLFYCTIPGDWLTSGLRVRRSDGGNFQAHMRASLFGAGCTNPDMIIGPECGAVPTETSSWGAIKVLYE